MSLSRWSHSAHYIYQVDTDTLHVSGFGHFTSTEIMEDYDTIEAKAKKYGYSFFNRLELRLYLRTWAKLKFKSYTYEQAMKIIDLLRNYGEAKRYISDPWKYKSFSGVGCIPQALQVTVCFSKAIPYKTRAQQEKETEKLELDILKKYDKKS